MQDEHIKAEVSQPHELGIGIIGNARNLDNEAEVAVGLSGLPYLMKTAMK